MLDTGSGAFSAPVFVPLAGGSGPDGVVAADIDDDNDLSLVVVRKNVDDVQILTNVDAVLSSSAR